MTLCAGCMERGSARLRDAVLLAGVPDEAVPRPTVRGLIGHAAAVFGVAVDEIVGRSRKRRVVRPRQAVAWVAREVTSRSFPEIGRLLGNRDHSTVIHAVALVEEYAARDPELAWRIERLWAAGECEPWGPGAEAPREMVPALPEMADEIPQAVQVRPIVERVEAGAVPVVVDPGEYVPRHALPAVMAVVDADLVGDVEDPADDARSKERSIAWGSDALLRALKREHPERFERMVA